MAGIFKAYDIRGLYGKELTEDLAQKIGRALVTFLGCRKVVVGRDIRPHSTPLFAALADGITLQGADVVDLGECSTPMSYYANGILGCDAGVMITASHNPGPYNGFKLARAQAVPISGATGIADIERIVAAGDFAPPAAVRGTVSRHDIAAEYAAFVRGHADLRRPLRIAADFANAMGIWEAEALKGLPLEMTRLYDEPDGRFPNHEANPLDASTLDDLRAEVRKGGYAFGVAFDGDADRAGFVDERGEIIPMDITTALIAQDILKHNPGAAIFYDLRSSWAVKEVIEEAGGKPLMSRVGHAFIKSQMREHDAVFAGELSGHYYFKANFTAESSALAVLALANIVSASDIPLSEMVRPIQRYHASGEINTKLASRADAERVIDTLKSRYGEKGRLFELDGVSVEFDDWWFNVRCSNTEPLIRLNLEAKAPEAMAARRDELLKIIRG
ncbi:MAG: phosphomannomutase/phosphoglucomutase [Kiritimatiellia bacterium]